MALALVRRVIATGYFTPVFALLRDNLDAFTGFCGVYWFLLVFYQLLT